MIYLVYIQADHINALPPTLLGAFMMKEDAEKFKRNHTLSNHLIVSDVDDWETWSAIRTNAGLAWFKQRFM